MSFDRKRVQPGACWLHAWQKHAGQKMEPAEIEVVKNVRKGEGFGRAVVLFEEAMGAVLGEG